MNNFLYYDTQKEQFQTHYNGIECPFKTDSVTQLPKCIASIRATVGLALTGLMTYGSTTPFFYLPALAGGLGFTGWTIYSHLYSKDSLTEAFYKISGGKEKFEQLPEIQLELNPNEKISKAIGNLDWDKLEHPIAKTKTLDGRNVVIIKALTRDNKQVFAADCQVKAVLAFVEKIGPYDIPRKISNLHELAESVMYAISFPFEGNAFGRVFSSSSFSSNNESYINYCKVYSSIPKDMANEFFAQLANS